MAHLGTGLRDAAKALIAAINRRNPAALSDLMTEDHALVDSAGRIESGRENRIGRWEEYFQMFPDYAIQVLGRVLEWERS